MKQSILFSLAILLLINTGCDRSDSVNSSFNAISNTTRNSASAGTWRVSLFSERGIDETGDFSGWVFTFGSNGVLNAVKSGVTKTGTWSTSSGSSAAKFNIDLGVKSDSNKPMGELTDDWKIISGNDNEIKLTDDNPASAEFLTFTKI